MKYKVNGKNHKSLAKCGGSSLQETRFLVRGVQPFGISGPHWKNSCLGPYIKYTSTNENKKKSQCFK